MTHPDSTTNTGAVETLAACPCGRTSSDDNAVQEASVILACIKAGTGSRAYRVECYCGWKGPIETEPYCAITAATLRATPTPASEAEVPAGMMLVPIEPTREMWAAGGDVIVGYKQRSHTKVVGDLWSAMLSAAPTKEHRDD